MLKEKRREVGDKAGKLKGGLQKLQETGEQVATMQVCSTSCTSAHILVSKVLAVQTGKPKFTKASSYRSSLSTLFHAPFFLSSA